MLKLMARIYSLRKRTTTLDAIIHSTETKIVEALKQRDMSDREISIVTKIPKEDIKEGIEYLKYIKMVKEIE